MPVCVVQGSQAVLGDKGPKAFMDFHLYLTAWSKATTGKDLVLKLMPFLLSVETMANSNFYGGTVFNGKTWVKKYQLRLLPTFRAIVDQAALEFPGCFLDEAKQRDLPDAVNGKCRRAAVLFLNNSNV